MILNILDLKNKAIKQIIHKNLDKDISENDSFELMFLTLANNPENDNTIVKAQWKWKQSKINKVLFIERKITNEDVFITLHNLKDVIFEG